MAPWSRPSNTSTGVIRCSASAALDGSALYGSCSCTIMSARLAGARVTDVSLPRDPSIVYGRGQSLVSWFWSMIVWRSGVTQRITRSDLMPSGG